VVTSAEFMKEPHVWNDAIARNAGRKWQNRVANYEVWPDEADFGANPTSGDGEIVRGPSGDARRMQPVCHPRIVVTMADCCESGDRFGQCELCAASMTRMGEPQDSQGGVDESSSEGRDADPLPFTDDVELAAPISELSDCMNSAEPASTPDKLRVSIVMATYNGEPFLEQQLASLASQTRLPHELLVCDDGSSDGTLGVVEGFAAVAPFAVQVISNQTRLGPYHNFLCGAQRCAGEIIAFCDQDDIWHPRKVEICAREFALSPSVALVVHSGHVVGSRSRRSAHLYPAYRRRRVIPPGSGPLTFPAPGYAIMFSRDIVDAWAACDGPPISQFGVEAWAHDTWVAFIGGALGTTVLLPDRLVRYRQHPGNLWGAPSRALERRLRDSAGFGGTDAAKYHASAASALARVALLKDLRQRTVSREMSQICSDGALQRASLWEHYSRIARRRARLYEARTPGIVAAGRFVIAVVHGDYGRRSRGRLGVSSCGRDSLYVCGLLSPLVKGTQRILAMLMADERRARSRVDPDW